MKFVRISQKLISITKLYETMKKKYKFFFFKLKDFFLIVFISYFFLSLPKELNATETDLGKTLFKNNCAGCHIRGGNIIRRSQNLKIASLKRNGIDNPESIAEIARHGIGIMRGYEEELGDNGDQIVANWVWEQAQNAWVQE